MTPWYLSDILEPYVVTWNLFGISNSFNIVKSQSQLIGVIENTKHVSFQSTQSKIPINWGSLLLRILILIFAT